MARKKGRKLIAFPPNGKDACGMDANPQPLLIGEQRLVTDRLVEVRSPWDDSLVGQCCEAGEAEVRHALAVAGAAFHQARRQPLHERAAMLRRAAALIREHRDDLAERIVA